MRWISSIYNFEKQQPTDNAVVFPSFTAERNVLHNCGAVGRTDRESGENNRSKNFCSPHQHRPRYGRRCRNDAQNNPLLRAPPMGVRINTRLLSMSCPWGVTSMQAKGEGLLTSPHAGSRERQNGLGWSKSVPFSRGEVDGQLLRLCLCSLHL